MLRERIRQFVRRATPVEKPKKNQWVTVSVSFVLAVILWFLVTLNTQTYTTSFDIPLKLVNFPENYQLIEEFPDNPAVWSNRGNVRLGQYKLTEAIADYNRSIEIAPEYPDAYLNRGIAYESKGLWSQAIADYNQVLSISPQDSIALNNRGNAKAGQENWQEALEDYQQAADLAPNFPTARGNAALMLYQIGDHSRAIRNMRNLVRKYPLYPDIRAALAAALWVEGQQGEAESNWVAAVGLDNRYQDLDWIQNIRRWPPRMVEAIEKFLNLN